MTTQAELIDPLLLQFASGRPGEMAALLGNCDLAELSTLVESMPVTSASSLAARLPSWQLTGLLGTLDPALIGQMLSMAKADEAVALVSHLHQTRYAAILETVSPGERRALYELLESPSHSVASLATTGFIRVPQDMLCSVFSEQLSASADTSPQPVLVVDDLGKYRGMLGVQAAYSRKNRSRPVGDVAVLVDPLNGLTDASTALTARQWTKYPELPVIDNRHRVLGVVSRAALERASGSAMPMEFNFERVVAELANGYLNTCARILESILGKPP